MTEIKHSRHLRPHEKVVSPFYRKSNTLIGRQWSWSIFHCIIPPAWQAIQASKGRITGMDLSNVLLGCLAGLGAMTAAFWLALIIWTFRDMRARSRDQAVQAGRPIDDDWDTRSGAEV